MFTIVLTSLLGPAGNARATTAPSGGGRYLGGVRNTNTPRATRESAQVGYTLGERTAVVATLRQLKHRITVSMRSYCRAAVNMHEQRAPMHRQKSVGCMPRALSNA